MAGGLRVIRKVPVGLFLWNVPTMTRTIRTNSMPLLSTISSRTKSLRPSTTRAFQQDALQTGLNISRILWQWLHATSRPTVCLPIISTSTMSLSPRGLTALLQTTMPRLVKLLPGRRNSAGNGRMWKWFPLTCLTATQTICPSEMTSKERWC